MKDVMQMKPVVEVEVVVEDVLQMVIICFVAVKATCQSVLTIYELFYRVQLTHVSVFLKQSPQ